MKHKIGFNRMDRRPGHRRAMTRNMVTSLFHYERIETTKSKALEIRRHAEKMITRAKEDSVHNRRIIAKDIHDEAILAKLFKDIGPRFKERNGGYTRVLKIGFRALDGAERVILELVDRKIDDEKQSTREKRKAEKKSKADAKAKAAEEAEEAGTEDTKAKAKSKDKAKSKAKTKVIAE